jgi:hypothetical protein
MPQHLHREQRSQGSRGRPVTPWEAGAHMQMIQGAYIPVAAVRPCRSKRL